MSADYRDDEKASPQPKHQESALHAQKGYETLDAQAGATYRAGFYILGVMFGVALLLVPLYWLLARRETRAQAPAATVIKQVPPAAGPAFPKLVTSEPEVLAEFRGQEDALLRRYGWVEKDRGIARIPISEALRLVGERGALPVFPAPPGEAASGPAPGATAAVPPARAAGPAPGTTAPAGAPPAPGTGGPR